MKDEKKIENLKILVEFAYFEGHRQHVEYPYKDVDHVWEYSQTKKKLEEYEK